MATKRDPLAMALEGKSRLLSWRSICTVLQDPSSTTSHVELITNILSTEEAQYSLTHPDDPFPRPNASSKQKFEAETSAIVTSTSSSRFPSIAEVKKEALALSTSLQISELSALRLVVLEYESRDENAIIKSAFTPQIQEMEGLWTGKESTLKTADLKTDAELEKEALTRRLSIYLAERRYAVVATTFLIRAALSEEGSTNDAWKALGQTLLEKILRDDKGFSIVKTIVDGIRSKIFSQEVNVPKWIQDQATEYGEEVLFEWEKQFLTETIHLLQLLFILVYKPVQPSAKIMSLWMSLMSDTKFLIEITNVNYIAIPDIQRLYSYLQPLSCIISLALISIATIDDALQRWEGGADENRIYIESVDSTKLITKVLLETPHDNFVSLVAFAWCIVVDKLRVHSDEETRRIEYETEDDVDPERVLDAVAQIPSGKMVRTLESSAPEGPKSINDLAKSSVRYLWKGVIALTAPNPGAFSLTTEDDCERMKEIISALVECSVLYVAYDSSMLAASIFIHDSSATADTSIGTFHPSKYKMPSYISRFWRSEAAREKILEPVRRRFPYEPEPFLQVAKALSADAQLVEDFLRKCSTFTHVMPRGFRDYEIDSEDPFVIQLVADLVLLEPRLDGTLSEAQSAIVMPAGTQGRIISEATANQVVLWEFDYSPLALLGRILEIKLGNRPEYGGFAPGMGERVWDIDLCTDIVAIFNTLIRTKVASGVTHETVEYIEGLLGEASDVVSGNKDVISIILDLLEEELQEAQLDSNRSTDFIIAAARFATLLARVLPHRVWPYIARSILLERHGRGGALGGILSAIEVVRGEYDFTIAGLDLFDNLVEEVLHTSVSQVSIKSPEKTPQRSLMVLSGSTAASVRKGSGTGVSKSVQKDIIGEFTRWAVSLFESYRGWKYNSLSQRHEIGKRISKTLSTILNAVFGVGENPDFNARIAGVLSAGAEQIVRIFLAEARSTLANGPFIGAIEDGVVTPESSVHTSALRNWIDHTISILYFADTLIRTRMYLKRPPSYLESQLCDESTALAKIYCISSQYRSCAIRLLSTIVASYNFAAAPNEEPPSLLGHLGSECANHFVRVISDIEIPSAELELRVWKFISAILSNKQQGMSILILRGETVAFSGTSSTRQTKRPGSQDSILNTAIEALLDIKNLSTTRTLVMLETVVLAQNFWSLCMEDLGRHPGLFDALLDYVSTFSNEPLPNDNNDMTEEKANKFAILAYIVELFALYLHSRMSKSRDPVFVKKLSKSLGYLFNNGVKVTGYRASLHGFLKENISAKWPKLDLVDLKKSWLRTRIYGSRYLYDIDLGGKILGFHPSWEQTGNSFKKELESANANLSLVDAQVGLLRAWKLLALELCDVLPQDKDMEKDLIKVVMTSFTANIDSGNLPGPIFAKIMDERSHFAFLLLRKLHKQYNPASFELYSELLPTLWKTIYNSRPTLQAAFRSGELAHFRTLLRSLYLSLLILGSKKTALDTSIPSMVGDLLALVVAEGARDLSLAVLNHSKAAQAEDLALITAILQAALHLPSQDAMHFLLVSHFLEFETIRTFLTLFSWSHSLTNEDPVYGELALLFLVELSSSTILAEQLAAQNVLHNLISTDLARIIRETADLSPHSTPRLHAIWSRGILPLTLNLLSACGRRVMNDVRTVLEFFKPVIQSLVKHWQKPPYVTLSQMRELMALVILTKALGEVPGFDMSLVQEGVDHCLQHKKYFATLVVATTPDEEAELVIRDGQRVSEEGLVKKIAEGLEEVNGILNQEDTEMAGK